MGVVKQKYRIGLTVFSSNEETTVVPSTSAIIESWSNTFSFTKEDKENHIAGLRSPQIGAIHAALSHWQVSEEAATIVMPTGTGKTETMLSLLIISKCNRLLIIVPTDGLRNQISKKFITLGLLRQLSLVKSSALNPIVGILKKKPVSKEEITVFFEKCNVVVSTVHIIGSLSQDLKTEVSKYCSHLFIDEAHHVGAKTWSETKRTFSNKSILQFTATPFRSDAKPIKDKIIFNYPLGKAQAEGYFRKINFIPIEEWDFEKHDESIARKALQQLRADIANGYNHVLMARVNLISRGEKVLTYYNNEADLKAILINSKVSKKEEIIRAILNLEYRIIVCVDMLGEGFDLPQLKIAAFHDIKKTLPITIQLAGRFTRDSRDEKLGDASIIVNLAMTEATEELEQLYASDSDWNKILPLLTQTHIQNQISLSELLKGFNKFPDEIQLQNIRPALSTVIFRTSGETWFPNNFKKGIQGIEEFDQVYSDVNSEKRLLIIVTGQRSSIKWGMIDNIFEFEWTLYVIYWNQNQQLLFINSSDNSGEYQKLADAITLKNATLVNAEDVFKSLDGVAQMRINNVGLKNQLDKLLSFTMHTGEDIEPALSSAQLLNRIKSNIFCSGYESGEKVSIGCSYKGRIWSKKTANLEEFVNWCDGVGDKILDSKISVNNILKGAIHQKVIGTRPNLLPISISWNDDFFLNDRFDSYKIVYNKTYYQIFEVDIELVDPSNSGNIKFELRHKAFSSHYELEFYKSGDRNNFRFKNISNPLSIQVGKKVLSLDDLLFKDSPIIRFLDGSSLEGNLFSEFKYQGPSYQKDKIEVWDWAGIDIKKESQGKDKVANSVQFKVIKELKKQDYKIIFDDDDAGEIADIIAVKENEIDRKIYIELFHLKYSKSKTAGARVGDLYEVCGQAQKSIIWKGKGAVELFKRMIKRTKSEKKRIEVGDIKDIGLLRDKSKNMFSSQFKISIVQPGLSKEAISEQQLELLASTENYLMDTYRIQFGVIGSV